MLKFSIVIPVYNRPDEVDELLQSLVGQTDKDFEVVVVEDGSTVKCEDTCRKYSDSLDVKYFYKENSGPGQSRNYGAERCSGNYIVILDSDVIVPQEYIATLRRELTQVYSSLIAVMEAASGIIADMQ